MEWMDDRKPAKSWFRRVLGSERRKAGRRPVSGLVAFYWDGGAPVPHTVRDISSAGMFLLTEHRWYPGTLVTITLQRTAGAATDSGSDAIAVQTKVVRGCPEGVGLEFILPHRKSSRRRGPMAPQMEEGYLDRFLSQLRAGQGQALIEYLLVLPIILLLIVNIVNFGGFFYAWITVANAARAGANYAILGGASVGALQPATAAEISALIATDMSSLPNASSLQVSICQNNNGTVTALMGTCAGMPSDPEPTSYVLTTTDVTYTYNPFIPAGFQFPNLNVYATIPPTTIHRRAVMRTIQ